MGNIAPTLEGNPEYADSGADLGHHDDVAKWFNKKSQGKGGNGTVTHRVPDVSGIRKICCTKMMGEPCGCEPNPTNSGSKKKHNDL